MCPTPSGEDHSRPEIWTLLRPCNEILQAVAEGIAVTDVEEALVYVNDKMAAMLGYGAEEIVGQQVESFLDEENRRVLQEENTKRQLGQSSTYRLVWTCSDGRQLPTRVSGTPLLDREGKCCGTLAVVTDISEQERLEATLEKERQVLRDIADAALHSDTVSELCNHVLDALMGVLSYRYGVMRLPTVEGQALRLVAVQSHTLHEVRLTPPMVPLGADDPAVVAYLSGKAVIVHDTNTADTDPRVGRWCQQLSKRSVIAWPVAGAEGRGIGVIVFANDLPVAISKEEERFISNIVEMIAAALERTEMGEHLRDSEERYRALAEQSPQGIVIYDREKVVYANPAAARTLALSVEETMRLSVKELTAFVHPDDRREVARKFGRVLDGWAPRAAMECRATAADGSVRWLELFGSSIEYAGRRVVQVLIVDVTEMRVLEEAHRATTRRLRSLFSVIPDPIFALDSEGRVVTMNRQALAQHRLEDAGPTLHRPFTEFVVPEDRERYVADMRRVLETGRPLRAEYRMLRRDGTDYYAEVNMAVTAGEPGGSEGVVVVVRDMTQRREMEQRVQEARDRALLYLDILCHDVRNHLQVMVGCTGLLREAKDDSERSHLLDLLDNAFGRVAGLIEKVDMTEKLQEAEMHPVRLVAELWECIRIVRREFPDTEVIYEGRTDEGTICGDEFVRALLLGILRNAIVHNTVRHDRRVWVTLDKDRGGYVLRVADNGPGIPDKRKTMLFDSSRRFGGVGLHLVKQIVDKYNGTIQVRDRVHGDPTQGAEFVLWLPVAPADRRCVREV